MFLGLKRKEKKGFDVIMNERVLWDALPTILMVLVQFGFAGVNICYKLAAADGMSLRIIIAYRFLFASVFILPIAFFLERLINFLSLLIYIYLYLYIYLQQPNKYINQIIYRGRRPKLTWSVLFYAFLSGLFG